MTPELAAIYNYYRLNDHISCAGQPIAEEFAAIKKAGFEVVINLATTDSTQALLHEAAITAQNGLDYVHIPVVWSSPKRPEFDRFCQTMQAHAGRKIFVHCMANMRVSAFLYLYQRTLGIPEEDARQVLDAIWQPNPVWQEFIDDVLATLA